MRSKSFGKELPPLLNFIPQVAQARYMSSYMLTFALLRDSSDLHIYKALYWERNKPEKNPKNYR